MRKYADVQMISVTTFLFIPYISFSPSAKELRPKAYRTWWAVREEGPFRYCRSVGIVRQLGVIAGQPVSSVRCA